MTDRDRDPTRPLRPDASCIVFVLIALVLAALVMNAPIGQACLDPFGDHSRACPLSGGCRIAHNDDPE